jgi:lysozyme
MGSYTPEVLIQLAKHFEGFSSKPYICPAGTWTIGYGSTRIRGLRVTKDTLPVTEAEAEEQLQMDCQRSLAAAISLSPILIASDERLGAIADFIYNLGQGAYARSTLRKRVDEGKWEGARLEILKWVWGGGKRLPGLVARRKAEANYL